MAEARVQASEPPPRPESAQVGRYQLVFELAAGGMASVFLAVAAGAGGFGKIFALKRMHTHLARDPEFRSMFLDEARVASLLHHPNLCSVLDYGEEDGVPYLTMEYLVGETLARVYRARVRNLPANLAQELPYFATRIIADACRGLQSAHELRSPKTGETLHLVHRDISPQNLFVTYDGSARVVDFGIVRAASQEHHTETGTIKGKFAYMAPEHILNEPLDGRADVWGLGVVLWELLAGERLFRRGSEMETFVAVTQEPLPPLPAHVPKELAAIVERALRRDKGERYGSAAAMADDLDLVLATRRPPYGAHDVGRWMRGLFPDGLMRKEALIAEALNTAPGFPVKVLPHDSIDIEIESRPSGTRSVARPRDTAVSEEETTGIPIVVAAPPPPGTSSTAKWFAFGAIALLGAAGLVWLSVGRLASITPRAAVETSAAAPSQAPPAEAPAPTPPPSIPLAPPVAVPSEPAAEHVAVPSERHRRARTPATVHTRPAVAPVAAAPAPAPAPAEPAPRDRRRPFLVESLDLDSTQHQEASPPRATPRVVEHIEP